MFHSRAKTLLGSDTHSTLSLTCLRLIRVLFDDALRDSQIACSEVSSTGLQPNVRLPAEPLSSGNAHRVRPEAEDVLHSTCKFDVCPIATGHESEGRSSLESTGDNSTLLLPKQSQKLSDERRKPAL